MLSYYQPHLGDKKTETKKDWANFTSHMASM